jgi:hypothetical protein
MIVTPPIKLLEQQKRKTEHHKLLSLNQRLKLAGAAILVLRASTFFQAAPAA